MQFQLMLYTNSAMRSKESNELFLPRIVPPFRPLELYNEQGIATLSTAYNYIFRFPARVHDLMVYHVTLRRWKLCG